LKTFVSTSGLQKLSLAAKEELQAYRLKYVAFLDSLSDQERAQLKQQKRERLKARASRKHKMVCILCIKWELIFLYMQRLYYMAQTLLNVKFVDLSIQLGNMCGNKILIFF
jgi:hypothetical protein